MTDPLKDFKIPESSGSFVNEYPVILRVLTNDPMVHYNAKYGNTKFAFVVWNQDTKKAQILDTGTSVLKKIIELHLNDRWGADIQQVDIEIKRTGSGKETEYFVTPLPNSQPLTNDQIKEAAKIDLAARFKDGVRMSAINDGTGKLSQTEALEESGSITRNQDDSDITDGSTPVNLSEIPF